jgi:hypothetical protein
VGIDGLLRPRKKLPSARLKGELMISAAALNTLADSGDA